MSARKRRRLLRANSYVDAEGRREEGFKAVLSPYRFGFSRDPQRGGEPKGPERHLSLRRPNALGKGKAFYGA
jgi:hypothetical protein